MDIKVTLREKRKRIRMSEKTADEWYKAHRNRTRERNMADGSNYSRLHSQTFISMWNYYAKLIIKVKTSCIKSTKSFAIKKSIAKANPWSEGQTRGSERVNTRLIRRRRSFGRNLFGHRILESRSLRPAWSPSPLWLLSPLYWLSRDSRGGRGSDPRCKCTAARRCTRRFPSRSWSPVRSCSCEQSGRPLKREGLDCRRLIVGNCREKEERGKEMELTFDRAVLRTDAMIQPFKLVALVVGTVGQVRGTGRIILGHDGDLVRAFVPSPHALAGEVALAENRTGSKWS